ncbi:MAG: thioredoxin domain-containing protein [Calditrichaeota bacterium]|nr:thioredoxin domain-containing protein [Calditrichota bacterium]MCB9391939.1 thioredoxin domain-containing protein [Calditrichota bacterium]
MRFALFFLLILSCSGSQVHTNALIHEASPYLLQHAHNPVDWLPWSDAAFEKARRENKPVFLSIGYAACHWCHVMEHESFENEEIAANLNEHFVSIKVDREERPDVDHHFMQAVQRMTGSGGWPLSVFLTPDRKPFYGGTYWAPEARYGRPGFMDVLRGLANAWETERDSILSSATALHDAIHEEVALPAAETKLSPALLDSAVKASERNFDPQYGGFSRAPKFPHAMELAMLLRYYSRTGNAAVRHMIELTLNNMARGGIFDQIGGGFHRYSTDEKWLVPHFEKMLYDNALLMQVYEAASHQFDSYSLHAVALRCTGWLMSCMRLPEGGYASSYDADSEGEEGKYYVWTPDETDGVLGESAAEFNRLFDITVAGNFEHGYSIPNRLKHASETADPAFLYGDWMEEMINTLLARRDLRPSPARDDKALCDWNGLLISGLTEVGQVDVARQIAERFLRSWQRDGELVHSFLGDKELRVQLLMDYAALGNGLLDLFCTTGELRWFDAAYQLADEIERRFAKGDGLYYMSEDAVAGVRSVDLFDSAVPSGNSLAGNLFIKLYYLTGEVRFRDRAEKHVTTLLPYLERMPTAFSQALLTAEWLVFPPEQVVVVATDDATMPDLPFHTHNRQVVVIRSDTIEGLPQTHPLRSLLDGKSLLNARPTYYVCKNFACDLPTNDPIVVANALRKPWDAK